MDVFEHFYLGNRSQHSCRVHQLWRLIRRYCGPPIESSVAHSLTCVGSTFYNGDVRGKYHGRIHDCHGHVLHSKGAKPACGILVYVTFTLMLSTGKLQPNPAGSFDERNWFVRQSSLLLVLTPSFSANHIWIFKLRCSSYYQGRPSPLAMVPSMLQPCGLSLISFMECLPGL